ncbi:hypothetical protein Dsin_000504 [Dipteronia sinensis]|uniref:FMR1-interacting protein 1 conserved domain-containing protein n=1 Tax=Dipteronia sinensis TaxID=43782 RepID=A0AAE0EHH2_9ROSI|nr:hypothetical protein Dsin_000504 [Dipteronia sinensis]
MQPFFNPFSHQIQSNASTAPLPQQVLTPNMLAVQPQIPYHLGHMRGPPLIPQSNPLNLFSQNNVMGVGHMFPLNNGQFCNLPNQAQIFPPPQIQTQTLLNNPQLCLPFFGNHQFGLPQQPFLQPTQQLQQGNSSMPFNAQHQQLLGNSSMPFNAQQQQLLGNSSMPLNAQQQQLLGNSSIPLNVQQQQLLGNSSMPLNVQQHQLLGNSSMPLNVQQQQTHNPQSWSHSQANPGNSVQYNQGSISNTNWKNDSGKNFSRNANRGGFQKSQLHHGNNGQKNFGVHNEHNTKGSGNERAAKFGQANHMNPPKEKKRSLALTYTDQEIQQWREERKRNYPSKANVEKKLPGKQSSSNVIDREAKIRREQLKEILAKQAELGVEVAEIPSHYLSESEKQGNGREENTGPLTNRGRFKNKHYKRGRNNRKDPAKKQKLLEEDSSKTTSFNKRKPTLLQKLLSTDIRRDKSSLLQVFRFMVTNSFFKDWPEKPLKFPLVIVKESGIAKEVVEEKALIVGKDIPEGSREMRNRNIEGLDDDEDDVDKNNVDDDDGEDGNGDSIVKVSIHEEEEEGEIID